MGVTDDPGLNAEPTAGAIPPPVPHTVGPGFPDNNSVHMRHIGSDVVTFITSQSGGAPGPNTVNTAAIQNGAVTTSKIANGAVGLTQIASQSIDQTRIVASLSLVTTQTAPTNLTNAPTASDFNNLLSVLKTAGVLK